MHNQDMQKILIESNQRYENYKDAILLGSFGKNSEEIIKNIAQYQQELSPVINQIINQIRRIYEK